MTANETLSISVVLTGIAQVLLRRGASRIPNPSFASLAFWKGIVCSTWIWGWAGCFIAATVSWVFAISALKISYAVPLLSGSYIIVALLSRFLLKERVTTRRWMAIAVITTGVIMIARS